MRIRLTFAKQGALRYIGHLDLHQVWERTIRRARLPLAYTQGFHPGPKMQIAAALPLGIIGREEVIDIWLEGQRTDLQAVQGDLQHAAPPGLLIGAIAEVPEQGPALQTLVVATDYHVVLLEGRQVSSSQAQALLEAESLPRQRRGRAYDLRPLILALQAGGEEMHMRLAARPGATGRPEEVLAALGIPAEEARITRQGLLFADTIDPS